MIKDRRCRPRPDLRKYPWQTRRARSPINCLVGGRGVEDRPGGSLGRPGENRWALPCPGGRPL